MTEVTSLPVVRRPTSTDFLEAQSPLHGGLESDGGQGPPPVNPLLLVHALLRGRYRLAGTLAAIAFVLGSAVAYRLAVPKYRSVGLIRVQPSVQRILYENEQNTVMPLFGAFVDAQATLLQSDRVIDMALDSPDWKAVGRPLTADAEDTFSKGLTITHDPNSEIISIEFLDRDPKAARAAVQGLISGYLRLYSENDADNSAQRLQILEDRRTSLGNELAALDDRIKSIEDQYGTDSLTKLYDFKQDQINRLDADLQQAELALANLPHRRGEPSTASSSAAGGNGINLTPAADSPAALAQLAADPEGRKLLEQRSEISAQIMANGGALGSHNPRVMEMRTELAATNEQIVQLERLQQSDGYQAMPFSSMGGPVVVDRAQAEQSIANIKSLRDHATAETKQIGQASLELESLKRDDEALRGRLKDTTDRIEQLNVEASASNRISVLSDGALPLLPYKDKRLAISGAGGLGLAAACVAGVALVGFFDRRVGHLSDPRWNSNRLATVLGILPSLDTVSPEPERQLAAAHGVHHIRTILQSGATRNSGIFAVTSASPGAGKTSLAIALGLSFAASGARTLIVDADITGAGLSAKVQNLRRRKLADLLGAKRLITKPQSIEAVKRSLETGQRTGELLIEAGAITQYDLDQALLAQKEAYVGLREAMAGEPLSSCVVSIASANLFVLPLGSASVRHVGQLSHDSMRTLLDRANREFDYVIVDTGPILGSLEASIVCREADKVVLTITGEDRRDAVEQAMGVLASSQVRFAGVAFNRASEFDLVTSLHASSVNRRSWPSEAEVSLGQSARTKGAADHSQALRRIHTDLEAGPLGDAIIMHTELPTSAGAE